MQENMLGGFQSACMPIPKLGNQAKAFADHGASRPPWRFHCNNCAYRALHRLARHSGRETSPCIPSTSKNSSACTRDTCPSCEAPLASAELTPLAPLALLPLGSRPATIAPCPGTIVPVSRFFLPPGVSEIYNS